MNNSYAVDKNYATAENYVIAKYIRLSLDDAVSDSLSIPNQRALLDRKIDTLDIPNAEILEFVDNGYTGTNLERPALQEMLNLVQTGRINCILVKDFSRFARNEIESSYYIERVFPIFRIRFIAVSDNFDSNDYKDGTGGIEVAFKFLMHEQYSHDLAKKIKSARRIKMKSGDNIVANAIYGYRKNMATGKWEPDEEAAEVVRLIYSKALESTPVSQIRNYLSAAKYPTPREYMRLKRGKDCRKKDIVPEYAWSTRAVNAILENEQYTGTYISGKYDSKGVGSKGHTITDKSQWIIIPDSHPPIVSKDDFAAVQVLLGRIRGTIAAGKPLQKLLDNEANSYRTRMVSGNIINGTPPYGYVRDINSNNGEWMLTEPTASRVREMFDMALQGLSCVEISQKLRELKYPSPAEHIKLMRGQNVSPKYKWTEHNVRSLLKNLQYTGAYVSGKVRQDYETNKIHKMSESDWIVIPDKHPAIISKEIYEQVQMLIRNVRGRNRANNSRDWLFNGGLLKCGGCGYSLHYSISTKTSRYYCNHTRSLPDAKCHKMRIDVCDIDEAVLSAIRKQAEVVIGSNDLTGFRKANAESRQLAELESQIKGLLKQRQDCYEHFVSGEIDREAFMAMKSKYSAQIDDISTRTALLRQIGRDREAQRKIADFTKGVMEEAATPKDIVNALVDKVFVFPDKRLEIHWKFEDFAKL